MTREVLEKAKLELAAAQRDSQALLRRVNVRADSAATLQSLEDEVTAIERSLVEATRTRGMLQALLASKERMLVPSEGTAEQAQLESDLDALLNL